ncbi:hypothetical protein D3C85_1381020 [compost metagenome]
MPEVQPALIVQPARPVHLKHGVAGDSCDAGGRHDAFADDGDGIAKRESSGFSGFDENTGAHIAADRRIRPAVKDNRRLHTRTKHQAVRIDPERDFLRDLGISASEPHGRPLFLPKHGTFLRIGRHVELRGQDIHERHGVGSTFHRVGRGGHLGDQPYDDQP